MKITIDKHDFERAFADANRKENFSRSGLFALFEYFEEFEESTGTEMELDVIDICCNYGEYASAIEAATEYGWEKNEDDEENEEAATEWLNDRTHVIKHDEGVIVASF